MRKTYTDKNVYEAAQERIAYIFDEFERVLVAFSGGKDSSVLLHMVFDYAKEHGLLDRVGMYHLDYEAQYQMTTDYVEDVFLHQFPGIEKIWVCLPISAQCACRMDGAYWIPWQREKKDLWVRPIPENQYVMNEDNVPFPFHEGDLDYEVQERLGQWYASEHGKTAVLIGIRADESLNRFRAIASDRKVNGYKDSSFIVGRGGDAWNCYPIYDWAVEDIWVYNGKFEKSYNRLYDLYYQAGLTLHQMRVASPFNDCAMDTLSLYKVIDPDNWGKMVSRVNGVNMAGLYGGTTAMGWKSITKPSHMTWKEYCFFLLNTLDEPTRAHYLKNLKTSIKVWAERGGGLDPQTIQELQEAGVEIVNHGPISKTTKKDVITIAEYPDDVPGVKAFKDVPSYKRMCVCILKNDYVCKYMGFAPTKEYAERRKKTMEKWKALL
jgi:predicted phosphoadenosine phosphosulfate sulfurtransferase